MDGAELEVNPERGDIFSWAFAGSKPKPKIVIPRRINRVWNRIKFALGIYHTHGAGQSITILFFEFNV